jgi:hypothetical protein
MELGTKLQIPFPFRIPDKRMVNCPEPGGFRRTPGKVGSASFHEFDVSCLPMDEHTVLVRVMPRELANLSQCLNKESFLVST